MIDTTRDATRYAVWGPGWGSHYLAQGLGSGHLAYLGPDEAEARRVLARERRAIARMRKLPHFRSAADTYALWRRDEDGRWTPEDQP